MAPSPLLRTSSDPSQRLPFPLNEGDPSAHTNAAAYNLLSNINHGSTWPLSLGDLLNLWYVNGPGQARFALCIKTFWCKGIPGPSDKGFVS